MNKLFIDNESYNIEEDNITISQIKRKIYVNGKLISERIRIVYISVLLVT